MRRVEYYHNHKKSSDQRYQNCQNVTIFEMEPAQRGSRNLLFRTLFNISLTLKQTLLNIINRAFDKKNLGGSEPFIFTIY